MKFPILIFLFVASMTATHAQEMRSDTLGDQIINTYFYEKGGDSLRYVMKADYTILRIIRYYRSGRMMQQTWARDSQYNYDVFGKITDKSYSYKDGYFSSANSVSYFADGQISVFKSLINGMTTVKEFSEKGDLRTSLTNFASKNSCFRQFQDRINGFYRSMRSDTLGTENDKWVRETDTTFYANGQVRSIEIREKNKSLGKKFYNKQGVLTKTTPADTLKSVIFKDNVDCFYGLKNGRGDTLLKPRFDELRYLTKDFFLAKNGDFYTVYDLNGVPKKLPFDRVTDVEVLNRNYSFGRATEELSKAQRFDDEEPTTFVNPTYFSCQTGGKYAVLDENFQVVIPPQYLKFAGSYLGNGAFFSFYDLKKDSLLRKGFMARSGRILFEKPVKDADCIDFDDYFRLFTNINTDAIGDGTYTNQSVERVYYDSNLMPDGLPLGIRPNHRVGLGRSDGTIVLPPTFCAIDNLDETPLFLVAVDKTDKRTQKVEFRQGIFNVHKNRWVLDTLNFKVINRMTPQFPYFIVENAKTEKQGFMDSTGQFVVPLRFDSIGRVLNNDTLFIVKTKGKYQILAYQRGVFNVHSKQYDFLQSVDLETLRYDPNVSVIYFIAKKNKKWGVMDANEKIIKPFEFDYARKVEYYEHEFILVKNNRAACFDLASLPNEKPMPSQKEQLQSYAVLNDPTHVFFVNDTGKVVIPPQYEWLNKDERSDYDYALVLDEKRRKKLIFYATSAVVDFPFDYKIIYAHPKSRVIGIKDSMDNSYGFVSTDGKILVPCNNYSIALADAAKSVFFVRHDVPKIIYDPRYADSMKFTSTDTLSEEDENWLMYDGNGQLVDKTPFDFPIDFNNAVGVGRQHNLFNLYRNDGTILTPFARENAQNDSEKPVYTEGSAVGFSNIRRDPQTGFYTLFRLQGMTPSMTVTKPDGEIVVESGRYDGVSPFFGHFALVSRQNRIGLIDSLGREIIEPQDLYSTKIDFMDSLYKCVGRAEGFYRLDNEDIMPFRFRPDYQSVHADLQLFPTQRTALFNLMLQENVPHFVFTAADVKIPRVELKVRSNLFDESTSNAAENLVPEISHIGEKTVAIIWKKNMISTQPKSRFSNFHNRNGRYEPLKLTDLLDIQGEKRGVMNDLITKKIKALTYGQIDCSNPSSFIQTVENQWQLTKTGVSFYFAESYSDNWVLISFTWAELSPFLKFRIY